MYWFTIPLANNTDILSQFLGSIIREVRYTFVMKINKNVYFFY